MKTIDSLLLLYFALPERWVWTGTYLNMYGYEKNGRGKMRGARIFSGKDPEKGLFIEVSHYPSDLLYTFFEGDYASEYDMAKAVLSKMARHDRNLSNPSLKEIKDASAPYCRAAFAFRDLAQHLLRMGDGWSVGSRETVAILTKFAEECADPRLRHASDKGEDHWIIPHETAPDCINDPLNKKPTLSVWIHHSVCRPWHPDPEEHGRFFVDETASVGASATTTVCRVLRYLASYNMKIAL